MTAYDNICEKLGFDFMKYDPETRGTEYDGEEQNPFDVLTEEELDFVMKYAKEQ